MLEIKSVAQAEQKIQKLLGLNEANWKRGLSSNCTENHAKAVSLAGYDFQGS